MRLLLSALTVSAALCCAGSALARPACAGAIEIPDGVFSRFEKNGLLILEDGRAIKLEGIRLPRGRQDRASASIAVAALARASELGRSAPLLFTAVPPKQDRYDRVRSQAFAGDVWIQRQLLREGLARVDIASDRSECAEELYAAEIEARARKAGLWSHSAYALRTMNNVGNASGTFQIVEGRVTNVSVRDGKAYVNFGADWKTDFTAVIAAPDLANFKKAGINPDSYTGRLVRVRGLVQSYNGPMIELAAPAQIEAIPE